LFVQGLPGRAGLPVRPQASSSLTIFSQSSSDLGQGRVHRFSSIIDPLMLQMICAAE